MLLSALEAEALYIMEISVSQNNLCLTAIMDGRRSAEISVGLLADDIAELNETFVMTLYKVEGGGEIDEDYDTSTFVIRFVAITTFHQ